MQLLAQGFHAFRRAQQQQVGRAGSEQAVGYNTDNGVDLTLKLNRVGDLHVEHVDDDIAVIRDHTFAVNRVTAQFYQLAGHMAAGHRDHFDWQRECAQHRYQLAGVGDADKGLGHGRDDLFAGQGCATAFDQVEVFVAFIGAINVELQVADRVQFIYRNTMALKARGGGFGAGHGAVERTLVLGQGVDKAVGRRAGTDPDDALVIQFWKDEVDSSLGYGLFELILGHGGSGAGRGNRKALSITQAFKTFGFVWSHAQTLG